MPMWEKVLLGFAALIILFLFWPGVKQAAEQRVGNTTDFHPEIHTWGILWET